MPVRERPYDRTTAVFKLNSDETAQILARDPRRPRRSREERRATAKEKRNGRIKSIVSERRGGKKKYRIRLHISALQSYPLRYARISFFQRHLRNVVLFKCRGSRSSPLPCKIHASRIIFRGQIAATFQPEVRTDGGKRRFGVFLAERGKPFLSFPRRRRRLLYRAAKSNVVPVTRPPVAAATFHKRSYERARLLRQRARRRLVLAFAICKSPSRAHIHTPGHYGTAILAFPLFFSPIRIWSSSGTRSLNRVG